MANINLAEQFYSVKNCNRKYSIGDAELGIFASNLTHTLSRNLADFAKYGVTQAKIDALGQLASEFIEFPIDDFFMGDVVLTTANKKAKEEQVLEAIREMALRVELKWGDDSPQYRRVGAKGMYDLTPDRLVSKAKSVVQAMTEFQVELVDLGLTTELITALDTLADEYEETINIQDKAMETRVINSEQRILQGNRLYKMVTDFCKMGRKIYRNKSLARFNEFVIYQPSSGTVGAPSDFRYNPLNSGFEWNEVKNCTSYIIEGSADGAEFNEIYSGQDTYFQYTPATEGWSYYRMRTRNNNGMSEYSEIVRVGYYATAMPAPDNINIQIIDYETNKARITWTEVPSASIYKVYKSIVPIGAASNSYTLAGKATEANLEIVLEPGKRTYVQITAESHRLWSERSAAAYIDTSA